MSRIDEIRARSEKATKGPWGTFDNPIIPLLERSYNAGFIAHSRDDIPYLLTEIDRLTAELNGVKANTQFRFRLEFQKCDRDGRYWDAKTGWCDMTVLARNESEAIKKALEVVGAENYRQLQVTVTEINNEIEQIRKERDAAVEDANTYGGCHVCKNNDGKCTTQNEYCKGQEYRGTEDGK
jgi:hypothetical protein